MNNKVILIPKGKLPEDKIECYEYLHAYFPDHVIDSLTSNEDYWNINLSKQVFNHCENIIDNLDWLKISEKECPMFFLLGENFFFCLSEALIPYGWSVFFSKNNFLYDKTITLLHLDSHRDLMRTRIRVNDNNVWQDLITKNELDFKLPNSILEAVDSGAIGIGSMVTPLIHFLPFLTVAHYNPSVKNEHFSLLEPILIKDNFLLENAKVMSNKFTECENIANYFESSSIANVVSMCSEGDYILLHIDMDSLNNRYNGDSDWHLIEGYDPNIIEQFNVIDQLLNHITIKGLARKIIHTSIGISPSFYPSEYWKLGLKYLISSLIDAGINLIDLKSKLFSSEIKFFNNMFPSQVTLTQRKSKCHEEKENHYWHVFYRGNRAGKVNINYDGKEASINVQLNKAYQGLGIGKAAFYLACKMSSHNIVYACIRKNNLASKKAAEAAGFIELRIDKKHTQRKMIWIRL